MSCWGSPHHRQTCNAKQQELNSRHDDRSRGAKAIKGLTVMLGSMRQALRVWHCGRTGNLRLKIVVFNMVHNSCLKIEHAPA